MVQDWIPDLVWLEIVALSAMDSLRDLPDSVVRNDAAWHAWYDNEAPERAVIPDFQTRISKFARMCVVKVRPWSSTAGAVTVHQTRAGPVGYAVCVQQPSSRSVPASCSRSSWLSQVTCDVQPADCPAIHCRHKLPKPCRAYWA